MGLVRSVLLRVARNVSASSKNLQARAAAHLPLAWLNSLHVFNLTSSVSIQKRLYRQIATFSVGLFAVMSFSATDISIGHGAQIEGSDYIGEIVFTDNDGYLTKLNPQTNDSDRSTLNDSLTHIVQSGETLSAIATKYSIKVDTLMWQNGLYNANSLKIGQQLTIPPADGVYHKIQSGDTLGSIASKYSIEGELIAKQNDMAADATLSIGQELFIPGAKGVVPAPPIIAQSPAAARNTTARIGTESRANTYVSNPNLPSAETAAVVGEMIWPTSGKLTTNYSGKHPALDIAKYPGGPIWSACSGTGTVAKVSTGTYGGGYGNHIVLDCGGGIKTLYAHMEYVSVAVGDTVSQGQVLGKMGNTGRVYGRTGVHLHFEVWKNGVKQNPWNYLQ